MAFTGDQKRALMAKLNHRRRAVLDMPNTFDTAAASSVAHWALVLVEPSLPGLSCLGGPRFCSAMMHYLAETAS